MKEKIASKLKYICILEAASRALNPAVRFVLPDLELGTVWEEKTNENGEEESERRNGKRDYEGSSKPSNALPPKRRCLVKVDIIFCLSLS